MEGEVGEIALLESLKARWHDLNLRVCNVRGHTSFVEIEVPDSS